METVIRVSRHRKCSGSIDLIEFDGDWIERTHKRKPPYGIACYMLSFGDLDNPELDCEIYLTTFELSKLQEYLNKIDVFEIADCPINPKPLNIMIKATANNLETCSLCGVSLSEQMHCGVWKRNPPQFTDFDNTNDLYWVLEFTDFHLGYGGKSKDYHSTQIQIECAPFQLSELRGAINGLLAQIKKKALHEQTDIDRKTRDTNYQKQHEDTHPKRQLSIHQGFC